MRDRTFLMRWIALAALIMSVLPWASAAAQANEPAIDKAIAYIRSQQQSGGSFAGFGPASTADAVFALSAAGLNVAEVKQGGQSALDYIRSQARTAGQDAGVAAKFSIALLLAGQSPALPDGTNLVQQIESGYNAGTARYGKDVTSHAYALIALRAAGSPAGLRSEAVDALKKLQLPDGGWSFDGTPETGSDTNTTALAIQALIATGDQSDAVAKALAYLRAQQNSDGGFPYSQTSQFGNASDANSTALSLQAIIAARADMSTFTKEGKTPADRLRAFQNPSGAFRFQDAAPEDNPFATYQAVPALAGKTLPLEGIVIALPAAPQEAGPAASTPAAPAAVPAQLPNTGTADGVPTLALGALLLVAAGLALKRKHA